jgi:hypothetical protein
MDRLKLFNEITIESSNNHENNFFLFTGGRMKEQPTQQ